MKIEYIIIVVLLLLIIFSNKGRRRKKDYTPHTPPEIQLPEEKTKNPELIDYKKYYQKRWVFTQYEKQAYRKLKEVTDELGLHLLAKVRLFDLVEPKPKAHITYRYRIQAKHVDFVVCDEKLVARAIIEVDDSSHNAPDRIERDKFVNSLLYDMGYEVIRAKVVDIDKIKEILIDIKEGKLKR